MRGSDSDSLTRSYQIVDPSSLPRSHRKSGKPWESPRQCPLHIILRLMEKLSESIRKSSNSSELPSTNLQTIGSISFPLPNSHTTTALTPPPGNPHLKY